MYNYDEIKEIIERYFPELELMKATDIMFRVRGEFSDIKASTTERRRRGVDEMKEYISEIQNLIPVSVISSSIHRDMEGMYFWVVEFEIQNTSKSIKINNKFNRKSTYKAVSLNDNELVELMRKFDGGIISSKDLLKLFSYLIETKQVRVMGNLSADREVFWRTADRLIKEGWISKEGEILKQPTMGTKESYKTYYQVEGYEDYIGSRFTVRGMNEPRIVEIKKLYYMGGNKKYPTFECEVMTDTKFHPKGERENFLVKDVIRNGKLVKEIRVLSS